MANKELIVKASIDTSGIDQELNKLRQKMNQVQGLSPNVGGAQLGIGDKLSLAAQNDVQRYNQKIQEDLKKEHALREMQYKESLKLEKELKSFKASGQKVEKEINTELEKRIKLLKEMNEIQSKIDKAAPGGSGGGPTGPGGPPSDGGGFFKGAVNAFGGIAGIASTLAAGVKVFSSVANQIAEMPRNVGMARGAISGRALGMSKEGLEGLGTEPITFAKEKSAAFTTVMKEMESRRGRDILSFAGDIMMGVVKTGTAGAAAGSLIPGVGTAVGGILGGLLGAGTAIAGGQQGRSAILNTEDYKTMLSKEAMDKFAGLEQANRLQNFQKYRAYDFMGQNQQTIQGAQSSMGLSNPIEFMAGMTGAGITGARGLQTAQSLMGESGRTMRDPATLARMRDMQAGGLTNSTSVFGKLMALGTQTQGQEEFKKVMEGAVRGGINSSEMVEETRRFADMATSMAMQSGVNAGGVARDLGAGMIGTGARDLQAAQTAYNLYEEESSGLSGVQGAMKMAYAYSPQVSGKLGKMANDQSLMQTFLGIGQSQFTEENPIVQKMMQESGKSFEELRSIKQETTARGATPRASTFKSLQDMSQVSLTPEEFQEQAMKPTGAYFNQYTDLVSSLGQEKGSSFRNLGYREQASLVRRLTQGEIGFEEVGTEAEKMVQGISGRGATSVEAQLDKAKAGQEKIQYEGLSGFIDQFMEDAKQMSRGAGEVNAAFEQLKEAAEKGVVSMGTFAEVMEGMKKFSEGGSIEEFRGTLSKAVNRNQPTAAPKR